MRILKGIALGVVQGLTEFLPVSSSGHLLLVEKLGVAPPSIATNLLLHVATLFAVTIVMRKSVFELVKKPFSKKALWIYVVCIPTAIIGVIFKLFFEDVLLGKLLSPCFLLTAILLLLPSPEKLKLKPFASAVAVGLAQGLAVLPGLSRSGTTIACMNAVGIEKDRRVELSFLISVPVIVGGAIFELKDLDFASADPIMLVSAFLTALVTGIFSIKVMLKSYDAVKTPFAVYLLFLAVFNIVVDIYV